MIEVIHRPEQHRFEAEVEGHLCLCEYRQAGNTWLFTHTEVPAALSGRGIAAELVRVALAQAQAQGHKVRPLCSYVATYMRRHPDTQHLLENAT